MPASRRPVETLDPTPPLAKIDTLRAERSTGRPPFAVEVVSAFGAAALLLAARVDPASMPRG